MDFGVQLPDEDGSTKNEYGSFASEETKTERTPTPANMGVLPSTPPNIGVLPPSFASPEPTIPPRSLTCDTRGLSKLELNGQRGTVLSLESPEQAADQTDPPGWIDESGRSGVPLEE